MPPLLYNDKKFMLEDEIIDIIQKAARGREVSLDICQYNLSNENDLRYIADMLQLDADKLVLAQSPFEEITLPPEVTCTVHPFGHLGVNTYQVELHHSKIFIDTGTNPQLFKNCVADQVLITHAHPDHTGSNHLFAKTIVHSPSPTSATDSLHIYDIEVECYDVSGHCTPATAYYFREINTCFVGDAIFKRSMGGCHNVHQYEMALKNIRSLLDELEHDTILCTGHGPVTTVGDELKENPFLTI